MEQTDVTIIGAGIVGIATAHELLQARPSLKVTLLEKEAETALHQTGHNSGVLHSGIYYKPGSHKALNCRAGKEAMEAFCTEENIPFDRCGKVIVATAERELPMLDAIHERGQANGVACRIIEAQELNDLEPHCAGIRAIHVPEAGIVDYREVCNKLMARVTSRGGILRTQTRLLSISQQSGKLNLETTQGHLETRYVINCAGLQSDRVSRLAGSDPGAQIVPFRGEYYELAPHAHKLCNNLIYPVPDPGFPFLGVHFTRMIHGGVECGPNAVLAFAREGYRKRDINLGDLTETLTYAGFWKLAARHWRTGFGEMWRSFSKSAFTHALQRLIPSIQTSDLLPAPAGVRAQALRPDGGLVDDFLIQETDNIVNVINAPSPAATSSLAIGSSITSRLLPKLEA